MKYKIHCAQDKDDIDEDSSWTITTIDNTGGWNTDGGYGGYGLPKEMAQDICDILNKHHEFNWELSRAGYCAEWVKK